MIVQRMTFVAKPGHRDEIVEIVQDSWKLVDLPPTYRIYLPITGPSDAVYQEIEFEDFEQREKFWTDFMAMPGLGPLAEKWNKVRDTGNTDELLSLVE